jgi:tetratricopeptide (TPR) repeat protein
MAAALSPNEEAQLLQTIEMFEVITQSQPLDTQSLEILKEAYFKLARQKDVVSTAKRIAQAYVQLGQLSSAILEYESVLQLFPDDPDVQKALSEIENRASSFGKPQIPADSEVLEKVASEPSKLIPAKGLPVGKSEIDDGRKTMHKIFVEGKLVSDSDFNQLWITPPLNSSPTVPADAFVQLLADRGIVPIEKSMTLLSERSRLCYIPLEKYDINLELARSLPRDVCRRWCILPFDHMSKSVLVATANPFNKQAIKDLEQATRNRLLWYLTPPADLVKVLKNVFR